MIQALESQMQTPDVTDLSFDDRFGMLVDAEVAARDNRQLQERLRSAQLRQTACIEDLDFRTPRGLDRSLLTRLASSQWVPKKKNVLIDGPTGSGKSFIACALAQKACRDGYTAIYTRATKLFHELAIAKATGKYSKLLASIARKDVIVIDDFGLSVLTDEQRHDFLEIMEDRYERRSTVIAGQVPVNKWHEVIGEPTIADAILDRIVHNAYKLHIKTKESLRSKNKLENADMES
jgi:DNA replication protein DnaC